MTKTRYDRLMQATQSMHAAILAQKVLVDEHQAICQELGETMDRLEGTLVRYQAALGCIAIDKLNMKARNLTAMINASEADQVVNGEREFAVA